jgi:hypothetical protein
MKRKLLIAIPLLCAVVVAAWIYRPKREALGEGYIGERSVTLAITSRSWPATTTA